MRFYIRVIDNLNEWVGWGASFLLIPLACVTMFEVFMRYIMDRPTIWAWDLNIQIFAALIMLGGGDALRRKCHVMVDVMVQDLTPRRRAILDLITSVVFFFGVVTLLVGGWDQAWRSWKVGETMPTVWAPPYYTMKMMIPIGALLVLLQGIAEFFRNLLIVTKPAEGE